MKTLIKIFSRKYIIPTIFVLAAGMVMIRLGFWQLDRLEQRREANKPLIQWVNAEPLIVDSDATIDAILADPYLMEYREVQVTGVYDYANQVVLRLRHYGAQAGVSLITPLKINGTNQAILVERGWIPQEDIERKSWEKYDETGSVTIQARIRLSENTSDFGSLVDPTLSPDESRLDAWFVVNVARIAEQADLDIVSGVYLIQIPDENETEPPFRLETDIEISEGSHFGYAVQWFIFASILCIGYPVYVHNIESGNILVEGKQEQL